MKSLLNLLLIVLFGIFVSLSVVAQDEETSLYTAPDNSFSFEYLNPDDFFIDATNYQLVMLLGNSSSRHSAVIRVFSPRAINVFLLDRLGEIPTELEDIADSINNLLGFYCMYTEPWELGEIEAILSICGEHQSHFFFALEGGNWGFVAASEGANEESVHHIIQSMHANAEMDLTEYITLSLDDLGSEAIMEQLRNWNLVATEGLTVYENSDPSVISGKPFLLTHGESIQDYVIASEIHYSGHDECGLFGRISGIKNPLQDSLAFVLYSRPGFAYSDTYGTSINSGSWSIDFEDEDAPHHYVVLVKGNHLTIFIDGWPYVMDGLVTTQAGDLAVYTDDVANCSFSHLWAYSLDDEVYSSDDVN